MPHRKPPRLGTGAGRDSRASEPITAEAVTFRLFTQAPGATLRLNRALVFNGWPDMRTSAEWVQDRPYVRMTTNVSSTLVVERQSEARMNPEEAFGWFGGVAAETLRWSRKIGQVAKVYSPTEGGIRDEHETTVQRGLVSQEKRRGMLEPGHPQLSLSRQCRLLRVSRSSVYHRPNGESTENLTPMRRIEELFLK